MTEVDLAQLRSVADRVTAAADVLGELVFPSLDPDGLRGSAVGAVAAPDLIAARLGNVVANMHGWAIAAQMSVDAFERSDHRNAGRVHRP